MAESVVLFALNNLSTLLQNQGNKLLGLRAKMEYIQDEILHIKPFLAVADSKDESDPQLEAWVRQIREISYSIEDVFDIYRLRFGNHFESGLGGYTKKMCASIMNLKYRREIILKIQTIKSRLENSSQAYQRYKDIYPPLIGQESSNPPYDDGRGDALLLEDVEVVGIEMPKKELIEWILNEHSGRKVLSVVGMGGLGKTTLIKKIYCDKLIKEKSNHQVWITISKSYRIDQLLKSVIKSLVVLDDTKQLENDSMDVNSMKEYIYKLLENKKYIIVVDDIWKINDWEAIEKAFPRNMTKGWGCIIVTTRLQDVGDGACPDQTVDRVYNLKPLPAKESKQLFYRKAFPGNSCPPYLENIAESILRRCDGLPLAIVVIGSLLATKKNSIEDWEGFSHSLGDELDGKNQRMEKIINLSFYELPYYLKSCFLYLSIFPEDEELERWRLIRLWTAHGFVQEKQGKTLEQIAQGYINELLNRSLIQIAKRSHGGQPNRLRIHDMLREYIIKKSKHEIGIAKNGKMIICPDKIRRIAFHDTSFPVPESHRIHSLRSLIWFGWGGSDPGAKLGDVLGTGCKFLKELDLRGAPIKVIPLEVFRLYYLKYLSLRSTKVKLIPKSIKHLKNLETLDLKKSRVTELPIEVLKLRKLRNLLVYKYQFGGGTQGFKAPYEIGRLSSLEKLIYLNADEADGVKIVKEIGKLTQMRRLGLLNIKKKDEKELCSSLTKLTNLHSLSLTADDLDEVTNLEHSLSISFPLLRTIVLEMHLDKLPQWIYRLHGLTYLFLRSSRLMDQDLECLQDLPNLISLTLHSAYEGDTLNLKAMGFPALQSLFLCSLTRLKVVKVENGSMPNLKELRMWDCKWVVDLPEGIEHLSHLQDVKFAEMSNEFVSRVYDQKRKGKNGKLDHVPRMFVNGEWLEKKL